MRCYFLDKAEAEKAYKSRIENMLAYLNKTGVLTLEDIEKAEINNKEKLNKNEKHIHFFTNARSPFWDAPEFLYKKSNKLNDINYSLYTAREMCHLFEVNDTSIFTKEMLTDENISKIIDLACQKEEEHNKVVEQTQSGYKSIIFSKIREQNSQIKEQEQEKQ